MYDSARSQMNCVTAQVRVTKRAALNILGTVKISRFALPTTVYTTPETETHVPLIVGRHPQKHYPGYSPRKLGPTPMTH